MPRGRVKSSPLITGTLASSVRSVSTGNRQHSLDLDREWVVSTLETYIQAWFKGDAEGMDRCLHPELTARLLQAQPNSDENPGVQAFHRSQGIQAILGACTHPLARHCTFTVLDIQGHSASARADLGDWVAFVHLAFTGERWAIVNVLWDWTVPRERRSA
jgi:hypothetical protein